LYGVGGAIHPDELLSRLTAAQWAGWQIYCRSFPTPMSRADLNAALIRQAAGHWRKTPELARLVPNYGRRRRSSGEEMRERVRKWAETAKAARGR
jgi:hypothetical protein